MQVTVVTLLVTPEQSERLALASNEGKIQLALRNPMDQSAPVTTGIQPAGLLGRGAAPAVRRSGSGRPLLKPVAPLDAPAPTVEIIRGDKRERTVVG
jgi:pilus assembly protein CpaB